MKDRLVEELMTTSPTLFAIIDGAREPTIADRIKESGLRHQTLFEGDAGLDLAPFGPYLVELPRESATVGRWVDDSWGKSQGVYLSSEANFSNLRRHLRRFLSVDLDGRKVYFRFYDPRVLRRFLPQCTYEEWIEFFGPIICYLVESEDGLSLLRFRCEADDPEPDRVALTVQGSQ